MKIFGNWNVKVETPFGTEDYTLVIDEFDLALEYREGITGRVSNQKDSVSFNNGRVVNNMFACSFDTEFPIKSKVFIQIDKLEKDKMFGYLTIDQYLTAYFSGVNNVSV
jgi:hypothetical protein